MDKSRILFCIDSVAHDAGPDKQLAEMIRHLDKDRFDLHVCCFEDSDRLRELDELCTTVILPLRSLYRFRGIRQIRRLRAYVNDQHIDVVHTFMVKANIFAVLAARKSNCKAIVGSRRNMGYWLTPFYLRLYRYLNKHTTRLLANSERVKQFVVETEQVPPDKVDVLYNGVDMTRYAPDAGDPEVARRLGVPDDAPVVGIVANLRPVKDHVLFLSAARLVADQVPDAAFLLVGRGPLRQKLGDLAADLGLADRVFFSDGHGPVPGHLRRMDVACLSSATEGFSNAILEYMAAGLPVVATDAGGNAEAVQHGVTGFIVPHGDAEAFAAPIITLLKDDTERAAMGRRGLDRCRERFEIGVAMRRYEAYYAALAGKADA
jgi:glycosyltransferase involved in cell wall biosynthesis